MKPVDSIGFLGLGVEMMPTGKRAVVVAAEWFLPSDLSESYWKEVAMGNESRFPWLRLTGRSVNAPQGLAAYLLDWQKKYKGAWYVWVDGKFVFEQTKWELERYWNSHQMERVVLYDPNLVEPERGSEPALFWDMNVLKHWVAEHLRVWPKEAFEFSPPNIPLVDQIFSYDPLTDRSADFRDYEERTRDPIAFQPNFAEAGMLAMLALSSAQAIRDRFDEGLAHHPYDDPFEENPVNPVAGVVGGSTASG